MPIGTALTWHDDRCEVTIISAEKTPCLRNAAGAQTSSGSGWGFAICASSRWTPPSPAIGMEIWVT